VSEVKTNDTVKSLCSLLSRCKPDISDIAQNSKGNLEQFRAEYRNICLTNAQLENRNVKDVALPSEHGRFTYKESVNQNGIRGITVFRRLTTGEDAHMKDHMYAFTTMDGIVNASDVPTLVEMRIAEPQNIHHYFEHVAKQMAAMRNLYPKDHGWILMLPMDYLKERPDSVQVFEDIGGHIAVLPYFAKELQFAVAKYAPKGSDTRMLVRQ
jgi:hypothetical protein